MAAASWKGPARYGAVSRKARDADWKRGNGKSEAMRTIRPLRAANRPLGAWGRDVADAARYSRHP